MNSPFSYKGKFIEGYTAITVLLPDMISKRLSRLIVASYYHLQDKRSSSFIFQILNFHPISAPNVNKCLYPVYKSPKNVVYKQRLQARLGRLPYSYIQKIDKALAVSIGLWDKC